MKKRGFVRDTIGNWQKYRWPHILCYLRFFKTFTSNNVFEEILRYVYRRFVILLHQWLEDILGDFHWRLVFGIGKLIRRYSKRCSLRFVDIGLLNLRDFTWRFVIDDVLVIRRHSTSFLLKVVIDIDIRSTSTRVSLSIRNWYCTTNTKRS